MRLARRTHVRRTEDAPRQDHREHEHGRYEVALPSKVTLAVMSFGPRDPRQAHGRRAVESIGTVITGDPRGKLPAAMATMQSYNEGRARFDAGPRPP